jgi:hypothetical protein
MADATMELAEILHQLCDSPAETAADCGPDRCLGVARVLVGGGWAPRRAMAKEFADALHAHIARSTWMSPAYRDGMRDAAQYYHGYCQAHGWTDIDPACPHARAKRILARWRDSAAGHG